MFPWASFFRKSGKSLTNFFKNGGLGFPTRELWPSGAQTMRTASGKTRQEA